MRHSRRPAFIAIPERSLDGPRPSLPGAGGHRLPRPVPTTCTRRSGRPSPPPCPSSPHEPFQWRHYAIVPFASHLLAAVLLAPIGGHGAGSPWADTAAPAAVRYPRVPAVRLLDRRLERDQRGRAGGHQAGDARGGRLRRARALDRRGGRDRPELQLLRSPVRAGTRCGSPTRATWTLPAPPPTARCGYRGERPRPNGSTLKHRLSFRANPDGTVRQLWETSSDGGSTWSPRSRRALPHEGHRQPGHCAGIDGRSDCRSSSPGRHGETAGPLARLRRRRHVLRVHREHRRRRDARVFRGGRRRGPRRARAPGPSGRAPSHAGRQPGLRRPRLLRPSARPVAGQPRQRAPDRAHAAAGFMPSAVLPATPTPHALPFAQAPPAPLV